VCEALEWVGVGAQGTHDARAQPLLQHATQAVPHALTCERSIKLASDASPAWSTWDNEDSCGARVQGRPSNRKSKHHLRVHRAALRPRLPRPVLRTGPSR